MGNLERIEPLPLVWKRPKLGEFLTESFGVHLRLSRVSPVLYILDEVWSDNGNRSVRVFRGALGKILEGTEMELKAVAEAWHRERADLFLNRHYREANV